MNNAISDTKKHRNTAKEKGDVVKEHSTAVKGRNDVIMSDISKKTAISFENLMQSTSKKVVTRIAPSPTGSFHIGTARTALFNYLFAKHHNGTFIVRFEDTDRERSDSKYETEILDAMNWLGTLPDSVVRQSDRTEIYREHIDRLLKEDKAYLSKEPSKKNPEKEIEVVRFRNRDPKVRFTDTLRGPIEIDTAELGDFVIARAIDDPLYNLAVVIDDADMGVTHILRGDDHIINTPRQVLLTEAIGASLPVYTHIPLIHSPSGGKLSKRKDATSVTAFRDRGYLPEAMINTLAMLGWNPKSEKEVFTLDELIAAFNPAHIQKKEAVFNEKKLEWFNRQHMQHLPESRLRTELEPAITERLTLQSNISLDASQHAVTAICQLVQERGFLFSDARADIAAGAYDFFFATPTYSVEILFPKSDLSQEKLTTQVIETLTHTHDLLAAADDNQWNEKAVQETVWSYAEEQGKSSVLWPLRVALSGKEKSPGPFLIAEAIGKKQTLARIQTAINLLRHT